MRIGAGDGTSNDGLLLATPSPGTSLIRAGARASTNFLIENDNDAPITFKTNGTERMKINGNGVIQFGSSTGQSPTHYSFPIDRGTDGQMLSMGSGANAGTLEWTSPSSGPWSTGTGTIYATSDRVGIGTTPNAQAQLDIKNSTSGQSNTNYAGKFTAENGFRNYAISAEATKSGATWNFGIYASAENATYNYAAYFPKGDVRIYDKLELGVSSNYGEFMYVDGTQGSGKVLTSDASGNASWQPNAASSPWTTNGSSVVHYGYDSGINTDKVGIGCIHPQARLELYGYTDPNGNQWNNIDPFKVNAGDSSLLFKIKNDGDVKIENNLELDGELNTSSGGNSNMAPVFYMTTNTIINGHNHTYTENYSNSSFVSSINRGSLPGDFNYHDYTDGITVNFNSSNFTISDLCVVSITFKAYKEIDGTDVYIVSTDAVDPNIGSYYIDAANNRILIFPDEGSSFQPFSMIIYKP